MIPPIGTLGATLVLLCVVIHLGWLDGIGIVGIVEEALFRGIILYTLVRVWEVIRVVLGPQYSFRG